jgi:drug/metabolite transporter (DMT)-like permease
MFASVLAYLAWNAATAVLGPNRAGPFVHLLPLFTTILAVWVLGEPLHAYHGAAALLIFAGIALATLVPKRQVRA